jgi:hypothetical protein
VPKWWSARQRLIRCAFGEEGIDELWGEPFKAFTSAIEDLCRSRYIKIARTMRDIDRIIVELGAVFGGVSLFGGVLPLLKELGEAAKVKCEALHTDVEIFEVWPSVVTACERLTAFRPAPLAPSQSIDIDRARRDRDSWGRPAQRTGKAGRTSRKRFAGGRAFCPPTSTGRTRYRL